MPSNTEEDEKKKINVSSNQGDVIGVGVDGNGNIIGKNISIVINEFSQDCGLTLLPPNHFKENTDTTHNFKQWKEKGYSFSLESIHQGKEFRRDKVLNEIKFKLEEKKRLLVLGESGTSKTTLLMETICDYFDKGYRVLYNLGDEELRNKNAITERIKGLVYAGNKVLVAVDNVHSPKMSLIFSVINSLLSLKEDKRNNILFILAARIPEFNWALERNLFGDIKLVQNIKGLFDNEHSFNLAYFGRDDINGFIQKYQGFTNQSIKNKPLEQNAEEIFKDTKEGHPILVRFAVLNEGLTAHVEQMYAEHLQDKDNGNYHHTKRVKAVVLNSLFDISNVPLKDETLGEFGLLPVAKKELRNTIIRKKGDFWETIHPKWDMQLFRHMRSLESSLDDIENSFKEVVDGIINTKVINGIGKLFILNTIYYTFVKEKVTGITMIEKLVNLADVEKKLDDFSKALFYATVIGLSYYESGRNKDALDFYDKALAISPNNADAYINKGISLFNLRRYEESIAEYDKALERNPRFELAYNNKGWSLSSLGRHQEAIIEYDKALEINPRFELAYNNKGWSLSSLGRHQEAIIEYDKVLRINPNHIGAYINKGDSLYNLGRYEEAIREYDDGLRINPENINALLGKSLSLSKIKRIDEAKQILKKVLEMESDNSLALQIKEELEREM